MSLSPSPISISYEEMQMRRMLLIILKKTVQDARQKGGKHNSVKLLRCEEPKVPQSNGPSPMPEACGYIFPIYHGSAGL